MSGPHPSRHSHERNLERSLGGSPDRTAVGRSADNRSTHSESDPDLAGRIAREAAEREAARRAMNRTEQEPTA